jgi:hypothetical protein
MKWVILILVVAGVVGVVGTFTNLDIVAFRSTAWGRLVGFTFSMVALVAALGCWKRKMYGWYLVEVLIWASVGFAAFRAIYMGFTIGLPWLGLLLGSIGEGVKIGIFAWVMLPFWTKQRKNFKWPNQSTDPTLASGTPGAGHQPRHP